MPTFSNGYQYRKLITIDNSKVGSGLSSENVPVLISHTDADLKTVANSGKVNMNPLLDIRFEDTSGNKLYHEIASYTATTGALMAWVRFPITTSGTNTFYIYFGKDLAQQTYNSIKLGIGSADRLTFGKNWYDAAFNQGEVRVDASNVKDVSGNTINLDPTKTVVLCEDMTSYRGNTTDFPNAIAGFLMYSATSVQTRFGVASSFNDRVIGVFRYNGSWYYDNNGGFGTFTPATSDILIARMTWNFGSDVTRMVDYIEPIYAGEQQPSYAWCDTITTFDETGFGNALHSYRSVLHMGTSPADTNTFTNDDKTVFETALASVQMDSGNVVTGKVGNALDFNGTDEYMWQIYSSPIYGDGQKSVGAWVKFDTVTPNQCVISRRSTTSDAQAYDWFLLTGQFVVDLQGTTTYRWSTGWYPSANTWYLIYVVYDGSYARLYVNGSQQASLAFTAGIGNSANHTWFGASHNSGTWGNFLDGKIDEYRSSSYTYSAGRLLTEYNNQNSPSTFYSYSTAEQIITTTQTGNSRIEKTFSTTQNGNSRIQRTETKDQTGNARIQNTYSLNNTGNARINKDLSITQTGDSRIERVESITQSGDSYIEEFHIVVSLDQSANSRIERVESTNQSANSRIEKVNTIDQTANARIELVKSITQTGNATVRNPFPDKKPQRWDITAEKDAAEWDKDDKTAQEWDISDEKTDSTWQDSNNKQNQQWSDSDNKQETEWQRQYFD